MTIKYTNLPLQDLPKYTQTGIFGLKTNYLATLGTSLFWHSSKHAFKAMLTRNFCLELIER
jgi:hypothetical protein